MTAAPESLLVSLYMSCWQTAMKGQPANSCSPTVLTFMRALGMAGIPADPVPVIAIVDRQDGQPATTVGSWLPERDGNGLWTGHLAMWLPTLHRFVDPTIIQANRPGRSGAMGSGIILKLESVDDIDGARTMKNGNEITYHRVLDPGDTWKSNLKSAAIKLAAELADALHSDVKHCLTETSDGRQLAANVTDLRIRQALKL